jgi:hypothetical protein
MVVPVPGRLVTRASISALLAFFLVLVLPSCWYGALTRAAVLGSDGPSSSNNNEEREEHQETSEEEVVAVGTRPPPPERVERVETVVLAPVLLPVPTKLVSVALPPHPAQFSVRRLI